MLVQHNDFDQNLLRALRLMAGKSPRAQADVQAALFRANLDAPAGTVSASLDRLLDFGLVRDIIRLQDGGVLVTVSLAVN